MKFSKNPKTRIQITYPREIQELVRYLTRRRSLSVGIEIPTPKISKPIARGVSVTVSYKRGWGKMPASKTAT